MTAFLAENAGSNRQLAIDVVDVAKKHAVFREDERVVLATIATYALFSLARRHGREAAFVVAGAIGQMLGNVKEDEGVTPWERVT